MPAPLSADDWATWNRGASVAARLKTLIDESKSAIAELSPGLTSPRGGGNRDERWMFSLLASDTLWLGLGFAANESPGRPESPPIIWAFACDLTRSIEQRRALAKQMATRIEGAGTVFDGCVSLSRPAHEVLTGDDFHQQLDQAVRYVYDCAIALKADGFLTDAITLTAPQQAP